MKDSSHVVLSKANDFGLINNSFTISIFFKLNELDPDGDYCIIGSAGRGYRKGLHLNIRSGYPYFGFYSTDVTSFAQIKANEWYHAVIRYDEIKREQTIFINAEKSGSSRNRPSFIGESEIVIGKSIGQDNFFNGNLDDLCIWNRPLSDEEVQKVYVGRVYVDSKNISYQYILFALVTLALLFILFIYRKQYRTRHSRLHIKSMELPIDRPRDIKNAILLFGNFIRNESP